MPYQRIELPLAVMVRGKNVGTITQENSGYVLQYYGEETTHRTVALAMVECHDESTFTTLNLEV